MTLPLFQVNHAEFPPGITCIEAGAGTGKTYNIALSVVKLLLEQQPDGTPRFTGIGNLLVVTFTTAATDELITRIRRILRLAADCYHEPAASRIVDTSDALVKTLDELARARVPFARQRVQEALASLDQLAVYTIHGFCKRVLEDHALETGVAPGTVLLDDERPLMREALMDWWRHRCYDTPARAAWLVRRKLTPDALLAPYLRWQQWPSADLQPGISLEQAEAELQHTLGEIATEWDSAACRDRLTSVRWNKEAPFRGPEATERFIAALGALWHGDLSHAECLDALDLETLQGNANKQSKAGKAAVAAMADWPEVRYAREAAERMATLWSAVQGDALRYTREWTASEKQRRAAMGFNDLLARLGEVLARDVDGLLARALRQRYQAALIDEFQDTDRHQANIFRRLFDGAPLVVIGDPKQAIYGFRGADLRSYLEVADAATQRFQLTRNFRSSAAMVSAVNRLFLRRAHPFLGDGIRFEPATASGTGTPSGALADSPAALHWLRLATDGDGPWLSKGEAQAVALSACSDEIVALLERGLSAGSMAVLVRSGYEGRDMQAKLQAAGVPAVVAGMDSIFSSDEVGELALVLGAVLAPQDARLVRAALATELWGWRYDQLRHLSEAEAGTTWDALGADLARWRLCWFDYGVAALWEAWSRATGLAARLLAFPDGERRLTNLRHAIDLLHEAASIHRLNPEGLLQWLVRERQEAATEQVTAETAELRLETDADAVQIVTIHKSKGLEYDVVFLPTLWNGRLAKPGPVLALEPSGDVYDLGSAALEARQRAANARRLEEDLRLTYVALTRARHRSYVVWGPVKAGQRGADPLTADGSIHSALGYLLLDDPDVDQVRSAALAPVDLALDAAQRLRASVTGWSATLDALVAGSGDTMALREIRTGMTTRRWRPAPLATRTPEPRALPFGARSPRIGTYRIASYTGLTTAPRVRGQEAPLSPVPEASDRDAPAFDRATESAAIVAQLKTLPPGDFRTFPAGAAAGTLLHTLFEEIPAATPPNERRTQVRERLAASAFADAHLDARTDGVCRMLEAVWSTPFTCNGMAVRLTDVPPAAQRHEWQFLLPLANPDRPLTAEALARCFGHGADPGMTAYANAIRALDIRDVHGFLTGVIDLVFEHQGWWYVVDWKSNRLPVDPEHHSPARLREEMVHGHYVLQYHLYLVAVHRLLRARIPGYSYDTHMGGAAYAFLRGFGGPEVSAMGHGWFTDRPSRHVIEALDTLIGSSEETA